MKGLSLKATGLPVRQGASLIAKLGIVTALSGVGLAVTFDVSGRVHRTEPSFADHLHRRIRTRGR